jgi:hypothetical protein
MGQRRFTQPRRIGRRAGGAAGAFWRVRHGASSGMNGPRRTNRFKAAISAL